MKVKMQIRIIALILFIALTSICQNAVFEYERANFIFNIFSNPNDKTMEEKLQAIDSFILYSELFGSEKAKSIFRT